MNISICRDSGKMLGLSILKCFNTKKNLSTSTVEHGAFLKIDTSIGSSAPVPPEGRSACLRPAFFSWTSMNFCRALSAIWFPVPAASFNLEETDSSRIPAFETGKSEASDKLIASLTNSKKKNMPHFCDKGAVPQKTNCFYNVNPLFE